MIQNYSRYKILQEFFDFPRKNFYIREISRNVKIAQSSVINHLKALEKEGMITKERKGLYPTFKANRDNDLFKVYKKMNIMLRINKTGLLDYIYDNCMPEVIILFGSASKGEDIEESDMDLFIVAPSKKLSMRKYEKRLNRKIGLFFEKNFSRLNNELKNNVLNGIILKGYLRVF